MSLSSLLRVLPIAIGSLMLLTACSDATAAACGRVQNESAADDSGLHVIPSAEIVYASEPPTSGPHSPGPEAGAYARSLTGPEQVGILERGGVLVQYRPGDIDPDQLTEILDGDVVVAPNPDLTDPIVMTAWRTRQQCSVYDRDAVIDFVSDNGGNGPRHPV